MVNSVLFSRDRAMQLDLTLRSLEKNCKELLSDGRVSIIYLATNEDFKKGYEKLKIEFADYKINFIEQSANFKNDVISALTPPEGEQSDYTTFLVDDDIL